MYRFQGIFSTKNIFFYHMWYWNFNWTFYENNKSNFIYLKKYTIPLTFQSLIQYVQGIKCRWICMYNISDLFNLRLQFMEETSFDETLLTLHWYFKWKTRVAKICVSINSIIIYTLHTCINDPTFHQHWPYKYNST